MKPSFRVLFLLCAAVAEAQVTWLAVSVEPPGSGSGRSYYVVSRNADSVLVERFVPTEPVVSISQIQARPLQGTNRWCLGSSAARVALLGRVTLAGAIETIGGTPGWIRDQAGCGLAIALPLDTLSAHAVIVELSGGGVP
jgi:hypothetical protein